MAKNSEQRMAKSINPIYALNENVTMEPCKGPV